MVVTVETMSKGSTLVQLHSQETFLQTSLSCISYMRPMTSPYITERARSDATHGEINQLSTSVPKLKSFMKESVKKRVSFADSVGLELEQVRHMTAGRDTPPILHPKVFESLNIDTNKLSLPTLTLGFRQPVSDYSRFKESLARNSVSLESVSLNDNFLIGTIKVKNIAFEKTVVARFTYDNWRSTENVPAYYVNNGLTNAHGNQISSSLDTFSFSYEICTDRLTHNGLKFVVFYKCKGIEFWDNNGSQNYLIKVSNDHNNNDSLTYGSPRLSSNPPKSLGNWTEFAVWKNLELDYTPYW